MGIDKQNNLCYFTYVKTRGRKMNLKESKEKEVKKVLKEKSSVSKLGLTNATWQVYVRGQKPKVEDLAIKSNNSSWARIVGRLVEEDPGYYFTLSSDLMLSEYVVHKFLKAVKKAYERKMKGLNNDGKMLDEEKIYQHVLNIVEVFPDVYDELPSFITEDENKKATVIEAIFEGFKKRFISETRITKNEQNLMESVIKKIKLDEFLDDLYFKNVETKEKLETCVMDCFETLLKKRPEACEILPRFICVDREKNSKMLKAFSYGIFRGLLGHSWDRNRAIKFRDKLSQRYLDRVSQKRTERLNLEENKKGESAKMAEEAKNLQKVLDQYYCKNGVDGESILREAQNLSKE